MFSIQIYFLTAWYMVAIVFFITLLWERQKLFLTDGETELERLVGPYFRILLYWLIILLRTTLWPWLISIFCLTTSVVKLLQDFISTWMSNSYLRLNMAQTELLVCLYFPFQFCRSQYMVRHLTCAQAPDFSVNFRVIPDCSCLVHQQSALSSNYVPEVSPLLTISTCSTNSGHCPLLSKQLR